MWIDISDLPIMPALETIYSVSTRLETAHRLALDQIRLSSQYLFALGLLEQFCIHLRLIMDISEG